MNIEAAVQLTRAILDQLKDPEKLDAHAWAQHKFVQEAVYANPGLAQQSSGHQLAFAVAEIFRKLMPSVAPKRGKRLDTRWGAFGLLAANYFAPFVNGEPFPATLREAWGKIDDAILLYQFGRDELLTLSEDDVDRYRLVGDEPWVAPISTISDWHIKGIELLAEAIEVREQHLNRTVELQKNPKPNIVSSDLPKQRQRLSLKWLWLVVAVLFVGVAVFTGVKAYRVYHLAMSLREDLYSARNLASPPFTGEKVVRAGQLLDQVKANLGAVKQETSPYLKIVAPALGWVPTYGGDIAAAADLIDMADYLTTSLQTLYRAGYPIYQSVEADRSTLTPQKITSLLVQQQPILGQARQELNQALMIWRKLDRNRFSPTVGGLLNQAEQPLHYLDRGLAFSSVLPKLLGASSEGPKTYLVVLQNEDEIRATGGFITSIFKAVIKDGNLIGFEFEDTDNQEDWSLPYPNAPWQMREYMSIPVLILRDANWFTDYSVTAEWLEYLYAYNHQHSLDGIIAIDQQVLVGLMSLIGPVNVKYYAQPVTAANVITFLRESKTPPFQPQPKDWSRKFGLQNLGNEIIKKLTTNLGQLDWMKVLELGRRLLDERHMLLNFDEPVVKEVLAEVDWDGVIRPGNADFLMVVDSNFGYNKANPAVKTEISYDVDLSKLDSPASTLSVVQSNASPSTRSCVQFGEHALDEARYPIYYCYWNYLRVYTPSGSSLTAANPQRIPADWMITRKSIPAQVDTLEEKINGVQAYGMFTVVPGGQARDMRFEYTLPGKVVTRGAGENQWNYSLKIKKQPGTTAIPVVVRVHLPAGARVERVNLKAVVDGNNVLVVTTLQRDTLLSITFTLP